MIFRATIFWNISSYQQLLEEVLYLGIVMDHLSLSESILDSYFKVVFNILKMTLMEKYFS